MSTSRRLVYVLVLSIAGATNPGCAVEQHEPYGTATVGWTVAGRSDAAACDDRGAHLVHAVMRLEADGFVTEAFVPCKLLATHYMVRPGFYRATLTLLDASRAPLTRPRDSGTIYVTDRGEASVLVDLTPNEALSGRAHESASTW